MKNLHVNVLSLCLIVLGAALSFYKVTVLKIPFFPAEQAHVWAVEARVGFVADKKPAKVNLVIPKNPEGYAVLDENFISGRYGMTLQDDENRREVEWTLRRPKGNQALYYRIQLIPDDSQPAAMAEPPEYPEKPRYPEMMQTVVDALLADVRNKSIDTRSFTHELLIRLNAENAEDNIQMLRQGISDESAWVERIVQILAGARIPARQVNLIQLKDGMRHGKLSAWVQVYNGQSWLTFDPKTGKQGLPADSLIWYFGDEPLMTVKGGKKANVEFSVLKQMQEAELVAQQRPGVKNSAVMAWSLFKLPVQTQNVYRILLMMPLGVLLIVILRNMVGVKSFGTFMPILIALSFRETELLWGVFLFVILIALGLMLRFYLEYLHLLLVPRLAAVLILVVILMLAVSLLTHQLGVDRGLSVALFPMVIITMTIERMSLVWEELGPGEAIQQGLGSLCMAALGYLIMTDKTLEHLLFVFPELLLLLLAITLLLGRYTGYRLTELWRFRALLRKMP